MVDQFSAAIDQIDTGTEGDRATYIHWYRTVWGPYIQDKERLLAAVGTKFAEVMRGLVAVDQLMTTDPITTKLQNRYLVHNPHPFGENGNFTGDEPNRQSTIDPGVAAYDRSRRQHHPLLRKLKQRHQFHDLFLINREGRVVYSVEKQTDFPRTLLSGPLATTELSTAFLHARDNDHLSRQNKWP